MSIDLDSINLACGSHISREEGMCLLEAVAYVAGEPHTDKPQCVCPVLAAFGRSWNDGLADEDRDRVLKPFIPRLIGTRSTPAVERQRAYIVADWAVRVYAPVWLRAAGLEFAAAELEGLAPLHTAAARPVIARARAAAEDAAMAAPPVLQFAFTFGAGPDAMNTAGTAARSAAIAAAGYGYAAMVATDAAVAAGEDAAMAAAAAGVALRPHVERLQNSAVDLYRRMIECRNAA